MENNIYDYVENHMWRYIYLIDLKLQDKELTVENIKQYVNSEGVPAEAYEQVLHSFYNELQENNILLKNEKDLKFTATKNNKDYSNTEQSLKDIENNKSIQSQYQYYTQISFDTLGNLHFNNFHNKNNPANELPDYEEYDTETSDPIIVSYEHPKDLTITFGIPVNLDKNGDLLQTYMSHIYYEDMLKNTFPYIFMITLAVMIITMFIPFSVLKENKFLQFIGNIKFGILSILWCLLISFINYLVIFIMIGTENQQILYFYQEFHIENLANYLTPIINLFFWFCYYGLFMIFAYMIKYLFHKGIKRYFIENTIIGWIIINFQKIFNYVLKFDFNDNTNKLVLKIVFVNFIIISIISIFFVFGVFFALVYSLIIFMLLKKKFDDIQKDYDVLLHATKQLSNGNFDIQINQDVGIFNPLKDEFSHIKDGFEKAVNEEVKSQKMKTELISNVSHDLKTPLTSIITYVDLLKKDSLTTEEKNNYVSILERNSLRLKNLIEDLFEVSKVNSGNIQLDLVDVDIVSMIKQAQFECYDKLEERHLDLRTDFSSDKIICHLDSSKTYRIFENLFINITKYALPYTRVYITLEEREDQVIITFKNISENEMNFNEEEIVERFVQGDKSRNTSGSGLGLAIVKSFTEIQKGQFHVEIDGDLFKSILIFKKQMSSL